MSVPPNNLPDDFFDSDKRSKKVQEDELAKEMEQFDKEMAALEAESNQHIEDELERMQDEKNIEELDQQIDQWKRILELEQRAEQLKDKLVSEKPFKKLKTNDTMDGPSMSPNKTIAETARAVFDEEKDDLDDIEDFEDKLLDWRSKRL